MAHRIIRCICLLLMLCLLAGCSSNSTQDTPLDEGPLRVRVTLGSFGYDQGYTLSGGALGSYISHNEADAQTLSHLPGTLSVTLTEQDFTFLTGYLVELYAPDGSFERAYLIGTSQDVFSENGLTYQCNDLSSARATLDALLPKD